MSQLMSGVHHHPTSPSNMKIAKRKDGIHLISEYTKKFDWWMLYSNAIRNLIPVRSTKPKKSTHLPSREAGFFSFILSSWLSPLMWKAFRKGMSADDVWDLHEKDAARNNAECLMKIWEQEMESKGSAKASLARAVWHFSRTRFLLAIILMVFTNALQFLGQAWVLNELLNFVSDEKEPLSWGLTLIAVLFVSQCLRVLCLTSVWVVGYHTAVRVLGSLQYMIYQKLLRLKSPTDHLLGKVVDICISDQERLCEAMAAGPLIVGAPSMSLLSLVYSYYILGPWTLLGNITLISFIPLLIRLTTETNKIHSNVKKSRNKRVTLTNNVLNNIKLIKMYAWEKSFFKKIIELRHEEHKQLRMGMFLYSFGVSLVTFIPPLATVTTILGLTLTGNRLHSSDAFVIVSIFNTLLFSCSLMPYAIRCLGEAHICLKKIKEFFEIPEYNSQYDKKPMPPNLAVELIKATFAWEGTQSDLNNRQKGTKESCMTSSEHLNVLTTIFHEINLRVFVGTLIGVCGGVGSGKSSLLSALVGEMRLLEGTMRRMDGGIAYVTQQAWILNGSLRENILFGLPYDKIRYDATIQACGMSKDIELFSNGDMTQVGENGSNLSGGQKQRVNLARAVYSDRDIYLLDDPLSAVDTKVASYIFLNCIRGPKALLKGKTIIMASHSIVVLDRCDRIIVLRDGVILENGTPAELTQMEGGEYSMLQKELSGVDCTQNPRSSERPRESSEVKELPVDVNHNQQSTTESSGKQGPKFIKHPFREFLKMCGGYIISTASAFVMVSYALVRVFNTVWLQIWLDAGYGRNLLTNDGTILESSKNASLPKSKEFSGLVSQESTIEVSSEHVGDNLEQWLYQTVYGASAVALLICCILKAYAHTSFLSHGSKTIHDKTLSIILHKPFTFFNQVKSGLLLSLFSKDMDQVDVRFTTVLDVVWQGVVLAFFQIALVCFIFPFFIIAVIAISVLFLLMDMWLNRAVSQTKRVANDLQNPVVSFLSSTVSGLPLIRVYEKQNVFRERFEGYLNRSLAGEIVFRLSTYWFTCRMDALATIAVIITSLMTVLNRASVTPAQAGIALSCIFVVATFLANILRLKCILQATYTSMERLLESMQGPVETEGGPSVKPSMWPAQGSIRMENICLRYGPEKPLVLKDISLEIYPAEKIGIVGRTGAGKSSLVAALMRLVELDSGRVTIDGVDISCIGLSELRAAIAVIPQDPVLFAGTLRHNLDPFDEHSDETLWDVIEKSHLKEKVQRELKGLMMNVENDGDNFSVGEKQLLCLARALLRKNKILLLDEATASVDLMTDRLIQLTLTEAFSHCTILTIAHRLDTILSHDRIVVLDAGKVLEFDKPEVLSNKEDSVFHSMLDAMGAKTYEH